MVEQESPQLGSPGLSREQKTGFVLLVIFAFLSIGLGVLQIRNTMYAPFALNNNVPATIKDEIKNPDALRFRDTDYDGLNDFEELYVHGTSPYLADTDSDGVNDKTEIDAGRSPTCPEGQECTGLAIAEGTTNSSSTPNIYIPEPDLGEAPPDLIAALTDPAQLRSMLRGAGMDQAILSQISDTDLLAMAKDILATNTTTLSNIQALNNYVATTTKPSP